MRLEQGEIDGRGEQRTAVDERVILPELPARVCTLGQPIDERTVEGDADVGLAEDTRIDDNGDRRMTGVDERIHRLTRCHPLQRLEDRQTQGPEQRLAIRTSSRTVQVTKRDRLDSLVTHT